MASMISNISFGNAHSSVQANNINGAVHIGPENTLDRLPRAENAPFNSYAKQHELECLPNTRVDLLQEIYSWADGQDERCIFWLSGLAGTGKSTIARTVANSYNAKQRLAASFFFSRGGGDVSHAGMFITSIAAQLADSVPASRQYIRDAVAERSDIARLSLRDQWHHLVLRPLSKLREAASYTIVVDALDECNNDNDIQIIVRLLAEVRPAVTSVRLRVLLTSRPEVPIRHGFGQMADSKHKDVVLHNLSPSVVDHDIGLFLEHWLRIIAKDCYYADDWPGAETIEQLVQSACGLFIWAATAYRFIREGRPFAEDRLRIVLKENVTTDDLFDDSSSSEDCCIDDQLEILPEKRLDSIYLTVLKRPIGRFNKYEKKKWYTLIKEILGAIVLLYSPLSAISLARLLVLSTQEVYRTLDELHSILDIPQSPIHHVRLHHPSFRDFLLNKDRCRDTNLWVDERQAHTVLTDKCIQLLSSSLKQDICGVGHFGARAAEIERMQLEHCILPEVQYACLYWTFHLTKSGVQLRDNDKVHEFLKMHFLHWLEALSWMGKVSEGIYAIDSLHSIALVSDCPSLCEFVHDMRRFALHSRLPIELAPLQVYSSALIFAPVNSIVKKQFANQLTQWVKSPPQVDDDWSACLQTLEGHSNDITSILFSDDSTRLASVSYVDKAKIWDVRSGECLWSSKIYSNSEAFSHDLMRLALGSRDSTTIEIWDISSFTLLHTLEGHGSVGFIAFSHDSMQVASTSYDGSIDIWDASSGVCMYTSKIDHHEVSSKAFSPDLMQLAWVSSQRTIKIWDTSSGVCVQTLEGHRSTVLSVAFSKNSAWLASGSHDHTAKIWDISSGECLHTLEGHDSLVESVAFSHDSMQLASGSYDRTIKIWDTSNGACLQTYEGYSSLVTFSHDSTQLASASNDTTVRIWDVSSSACPRTHERHNGNVSPETFSHGSVQDILDAEHCHCLSLEEIEEHVYDYTEYRADHSPPMLLTLTWAASGSSNGTIKVTHRKHCTLLKTLEGHRGSIEALNVSYDLTRLMSASKDKTVKIWDVSSGACLQTFESYTDHHFSSIEISRDSVLLGSVFDDGSVKIWDIRSGSCLQTLESCGTSLIEFSCDSMLLASVLDNGAVKMWDINSGACLWTRHSHNYPIDRISFSDDSTQLVSVSLDSTINIWDINSGTRLQTLRTCKLHSHCITDVFALLYTGETAKTQQITDFSINISADSAWITRYDRDWLWLPAEYRPGHFFISDGYIAVTTPSGRSWTCNFV